MKQSRASDRAVELDQGLRSLVQQLSTLPTHVRGQAEFVLLMSTDSG